MPVEADLLKGPARVPEIDEGLSGDGRASAQPAVTPAAAPCPIELELSNPAFVGPLGLLLELIESRRLPITDVSLAEVADQYLERLRDMAGLNPDLLSDFLVVAARLLVIKSRALLPQRVNQADEEESADDLQQRLLEYRLFRDAANSLKEMEASGRRSYPRQPAITPTAGPEPPLAPIAPESLRDAMARMMRALRPEQGPVEMTPRISVKERIEHLLEVLGSRPSARFSEVAGQSVAAIVATFLAILELLRRGILCARQEEAFAEISISLAAATTASW